MRYQNSPPPKNNMLIEVKTIKNTNFIFIAKWSQRVATSGLQRTCLNKAKKLGRPAGPLALGARWPKYKSPILWVNLSKISWTTFFFQKVLWIKGHLIQHPSFIVASRYRHAIFGVNITSKINQKNKEKQILYMFAYVHLRTNTSPLY